MSSNLILVAPGLYFDKTFVCGSRKSKNVYGKEELLTFAKALGIKPVPKKNIDICNTILKRLAEIHGDDVIKPPKDVYTNANALTSLQFSKTYDCKLKGKNSLSLDDFKKMAKDLKLSKISGLNKEKLCEKIKQVKFAKSPTKSPTKSPAKSPTSKSPLGYVHDSNFVKIGKNLVFNMDVDCDAKKTKSNPQNYNKDDLLKFASELGLKLKKTNSDSCRAIKNRIKELYPKNVPDGDSVKSLSPTPKKSMGDEELIQAIRKCLKLKN